LTEPAHPCNPSLLKPIVSEAQQRCSIPNPHGPLYQSDVPSLQETCCSAPIIQVDEGRTDLKPVQDLAPDFALPAQVNLYATDETNTQGTAISPETGNLVTDYLQGAYLQHDVSAPHGQLTVATANQWLLLNIPAGTKLFNRAVIKDGSPLQENILEALLPVVKRNH
jgi:hypothetical protein